MEVIANTTIISNFAAVGRLGLLCDVLERVFISTEIYAEIQDGLAGDSAFYEGIEHHIHPFAADGWLRLTALEGDDELRLFGELPDALHRAEASCLAIAAHRGWALLTDDARARKAAHNWNVVVSGTLGVLVQAVRRGLLTLEDADALLAEMIAAGYRSPYGSLAQLVS
jgi:predicted nucleic acid-binding protein